ncbi:MAG: aldo/keto reductase [Candidatus Heimdallarchaeota archaeon]|nr:aldo/keto reductase [Candidatus Heimdallarchaeota archaeon]
MSEIKLPNIGLGTWMLKPKDATFSTIEAIKMGYRFVDTAQAYRNEAGVGIGLQEAFKSGLLEREDLIVATKFFPMFQRPSTVKKTALRSLKRLQLDYVDIFYVHYPAFALGYSHKKTLNAISELVDEGKVKHIGISNFTVQLTKDAQEACKKPIFANQVEHHPYLQQKDLLKYLKEQSINFISYSPLGRGHVLKDEIVKEIAARNSISAAQVCLAWVMQKGAIPIPKATSLEHIKDNLAALDVKLSEEDIQKIDSITTEERYVHPPVVSPKEWKK